MSVVQLISQVLMAMQPNISTESETDDIINDERFKRGFGMMNNINLGDLLSGAQKVAEAVEKFQQLNE